MKRRKKCYAKYFKLCELVVKQSIKRFFIETNELK